MEYKKNDLLTVTIEDMGHDGEGIGKVDGYTVFVKDTVIGDKVQAKIMKAKKNYGYARLVEIMEPSKDGSSHAVRTPVSAAAARSRHFLMKNSWHTNSRRLKII